MYVGWRFLIIFVYKLVDMYFVPKKAFVGASMLRLQEELRGKDGILNIRYVPSTPLDFMASSLA